jgi:hypothetical protein
MLVFMGMFEAAVTPYAYYLCTRKSLC